MRAAKHHDFTDVQPSTSFDQDKRQAPPRMKTRLLRRGNPQKLDGHDIFEDEQRSAFASPKPSHGTITVIAGPNRGSSFELGEDYMRIGRSKSHEIQLLEDDAVSRDSHAIIGYVPDFHRYIIFDGGKVNPVLVNGAVVSDAALLKDGDIIKIGESALFLTN